MKGFCVVGSGIAGSTIANLSAKKSSLEIFDKAKGSFWRKKFSKMENSWLSSTVSLYERNKKKPANFLAGFFNNYLVLVIN